MRRATLATAVLALLLAAVAPAAASASIRTYRLTFSGTMSASYTASDSTAFNVNRAGYGGCDFKQTGDFKLAWRDVWLAEFAVSSRSGHLALIDAKRVSGPAQKGRPGDSEISGVNSNEPPSSQCYEAGSAGEYDCTAEALTPSGSVPVKFAVDPDRPKSYLTTITPFFTAKATYSGSAPPSLPCSALGSNLSPGGFIAFPGGSTMGLDAGVNLSLPHAQLLGLKRGQSLKGEGLTTADGGGWLWQDFPSPGDSCAIDSPSSDEVCSYDSAKRSGALTIKRLR